MGFVFGVHIVVVELVFIPQITFLFFVFVVEAEYLLYHLLILLLQFYA